MGFEAASIEGNTATLRQAMHGALYCVSLCKGTRSCARAGPGWTDLIETATRQQRYRRLACSVLRRLRVLASLSESASPGCQLLLDPARPPPADRAASLSDSSPRTKSACMPRLAACLRVRINGLGSSGIVPLSSVGCASPARCCRRRPVGGIAATSAGATSG